MAETNFAKAMKILEGYGITETHLEETTNHVMLAAGGKGPAGGGPLVLSNDPAESSVPPRFIEVKDVDELKRIGGIPDSLYDEGWAHERELPQASTASVLNTEDPLHADICSALKTYVYGDSRKVSDYRDAVNRLRFPMKVATFAAKDLTVTKDTPLIVRDADGHGNPINLVFDHVTVYAGGQIIWQAPGKMTCTSITYSDTPGPGGQTGMLAAEAPSGGSSYISQGGDGGAGGDGGDGADMPKGAKGASGRNNKNSCASKATNGKPGRPGGDGGDASEGGEGGDAEEIYVDVDELNGTIPVGSSGGKGGRGGDGGDGGRGGDGGDGGDGTSQCSPGTGGEGGKGGKAGRGGDGGPGGNGNRIFITYKTGNPNFQQVSTGGGGDAGSAGDAGGAGAGGNPGGDGGDPGDGAEPAEPGKGGAPGKVFINGKELDPPSA